MEIWEKRKPWTKNISLLSYFSWSLLPLYYMHLKKASTSMYPKTEIKCFWWHKNKIQSNKLNSQRGREGTKHAEFFNSLWSQIKKRTCNKFTGWCMEKLPSMRIQGNLQKILTLCSIYFQSSFSFSMDDRTKWVFFIISRKINSDLPIYQFLNHSNYNYTTLTRL